VHSFTEQPAHAVEVVPLGALVFAPPPEEDVAHFLDVIQAERLGGNRISVQLACVLLSS
jgi:hypothetical protein